MTIYILGLGDDTVKIGHTNGAKAGTGEKHIKDLQTASPYPMKLLATSWGGLEQKAYLHKRWQEYHIRGDCSDAKATSPRGSCMAARCTTTSLAPTSTYPWVKRTSERRGHADDLFTMFEVLRWNHYHPDELRRKEELRQKNIFEYGDYIDRSRQGYIGQLRQYLARCIKGERMDPPEFWGHTYHGRCGAGHELPTPPKPSQPTCDKPPHGVTYH